MRRIKKSFTVTTIFASLAQVVAGNVTITELEPLDTMETVTDNNVVKVYKKLAETKGVKNLDNGNIIVTGTMTNTVTYAMSAEDFIAHGYVVEDEAPEKAD